MQNTVSPGLTLVSVVLFSLITFGCTNSQQGPQEVVSGLTSTQSIAVSVSTSSDSGESAVFEVPPLVLDPIRNLLRPESFVDRFSYAYGYLLMDSAVRQDMSLSPQYLAKGLLDASELGKGYFTAAEIQAIFTEYNNIVLARAQADYEELARKNLQQAEEFLAGNKTKDNVSTTFSGLQYMVLDPGSGAKPQPYDTVTVNYTITLLDGSLIDSTQNAGSSLKLAAQTLSSGLREGLLMMNTGAHYRFWVHPNLGYGEYGFSTIIEPNVLLVMDVTLENIIAPEKVE